MKPSTVLVSDATRNPGLALIRELGRARYNVRGADARRLPLGLHSRYSPPYLHYGPSSRLELSAALLETVRAVRPEVFLPVSTNTTQVVSKNRPLFETLTKVNVPEYDAFQTAMDNEQTIRTCTELQIPCPRLLEPDEAHQLLSGAQASSEPARVVVKPRLDLGAARGVRYPTTPRALEAAVDANSKYLGDSVLQEYIPGDTTAMRVALLLFDRNAQLIAYFTAKKILQWPETGGVTAVSESTYEPELVRQVLPFFEHLGWQGLAEVELKCDSRDGIPKVIEVNPRMPSYLGFPERCGIPLSTMMVEAASKGWSGPICPSYPAGVRLVRTGEVLKILLHRLRSETRKAGTFGQAWAEIRSGIRPASLDFTDPLPRVGKLLCELTSVGSSEDSQMPVAPGE